MKASTFARKLTPPPAPALAALRQRFERCRQALGEVDWVSEGSVTENHPGTWRWTRKVAGRTVTVAITAAQARAFRQAIANHRHLKKLTHKMRLLSQEALRTTIPGPARRP